jgi:hypothetical protein
MQGGTLRILKESPTSFKVFVSSTRGQICLGMVELSSDSLFLAFNNLPSLDVGALKMVLEGFSTLVDRPDFELIRKALIKYIADGR